VSDDHLAPDGIAAIIAAHGLERFVSDVIIEGSLGDTTSHTSGRMTGRMTVIARVSGRRLWTVDQKLLMLRDAFGSGGEVRTAMERHEVSSGQLYTWRKQAMSGELSGFSAPALPSPLPQPVPCFAEVEIAEPEQPPPRAIAELAQVSIGQIGIELSSGIKLTVDAGVDADALARVLSVVGR
jgi:transposase